MVGGGWILLSSSCRLAGSRGHGLALLSSPAFIYFSLFQVAGKGRWRGELAWEPADGHAKRISLERTMEVTLKALSGSLLLLLKHFKVNHVYQFEHLAMTIAGFRGIPLILKFLNRKIETFLTALNE